VSARKEQIRDLLRGARARIHPSDVGLSSADRRRSPGLRREDAAVLAGLSVKWYTWLEQGRDINFSSDVLDRVSRALRLSPAEREYLLGLMRKDPVPIADGQDPLTESVWRTIQFVPVPALAMTLRWDIVAWNPLITRMFRDYGSVPRAERNLLRIVLTDKKYQGDPDAYDTIARKLIGEFRVDFGRHANDPSFEQLIADLRRLAPGFEQRWSDVTISDAPRGSLVQHNELGDLWFDRVSYLPEGSRFLRVLMFTPRDPKTAGIIDAIRAETTAAPVSKTDSETDMIRHINRH
jgi:transcriptional regulator with XRE-family HTH domain